MHFCKILIFLILTKQKKLIAAIFLFITNIEKKILNENSVSLAATYSLKVYSFSKCAEIEIILGILLIIALIFLEKFYDKPNLKKGKDNEMEIAIKDFNKNNMNNGYFLSVNDSVILLFRIKDEFKSYDESYNSLVDKSKEILNNNNFNN